MKARLVAAGVVALVALPADAAFAVDVVNHDRNPYQVVVLDDSGQRTLEILAGQSLRNICSACSITIETDDPIEAKGPEAVLIKDGRLRIRI